MIDDYDLCDNHGSGEDGQAEIQTAAINSGICSVNWQRSENGQIIMKSAIEKCMECEKKFRKKQHKRSIGAHKEE